MIPYLDTAVVGFFQALFINNAVIWAPPEVSRQSLARAGDEDAQGKINVPGLSVFRTRSTKMPYTNKSATAVGWDLKDRLFTGPNAGQFQNIGICYVGVTYEVVAWAKYQSDINYIERKLWFCEDYKPVPVRVPFVDPNTNKQIIDANGGVKFDDQGNPLFNEFPLKIHGLDDVEYDRLIDEKTGKIVFYALKRTFQVEAPWLSSRFDPVIEEIVLHVKMAQGDVLNLPISLATELTELGGADEDTLTITEDGTTPGP